jgi:hypothetical protein
MAFADEGDPEGVPGISDPFRGSKWSSPGPKVRPLIMSSKPRSRLRVWLGVVLLAALAAVCVLVYLSRSALVSRFGTVAGPAAPSNTRAAFQTKVTGGQVEFEMVYGRDVTGIVRVTVTDPDGTQLWVLSGPGQGRTPKIVYGVVPADGQFRWAQEWPVDGTPPPDIRGRRVKVRIDTRFSIPFGPGVEISEAEIDVPKE